MARAETDAIGDARAAVERRDYRAAVDALRPALAKADDDGQGRATAMAVLVAAVTGGADEATRRGATTRRPSGCWSTGPR